MRVGYDAKRAFGNTTGLGNYARTLISGVERQCPDWELYLFTPYQKIAFASKAKVVTPRGFFTRTFHPFWRSYLISREVSNLGLKLDIFHGLTHEIPYGIHSMAKTVVTIHDLIYQLLPGEFRYLDRTIYDCKLRYSTRHAHHILTFSEDTKKHIIHYFKVPEDKVQIIPQSCHSAFLRSYSQEEIDQCCKQYALSRPYIHFVGSFIPRKRPWESLQAFLQIAGEVDNDLVMIGQGPLRKKCQLLVSEKGLDQRVHFISPRSPEEMAKIFQGSQLLLFPSVAEGFGIPLIEAHFTQTAVMTTSYSCRSGEK